MVKTITKIGNSQGLIFDQTLMDLARLKVGDNVDITLHDGGSLTITPIRQEIGPKQAAETARALIKKNKELFRRLSK
jgi:antitoxin component of MazEF toxin-antitoxin module